MKPRITAPGLPAQNGGARHSGIGMTSARTRERLVQRLRDQGIVNPQVLE